MTYLDNSTKMLTEFNWLYKSWIDSGCWQTADLIVVHHPALTEQLPHTPGVVLIPKMPFSGENPLFADYPFINSIACLTGPHMNEVLGSYQWLLRTDADVFLTSFMAGFEAVFPVHGRGNYYFMQEFRDRMLAFCQRHQVPHMQRFGCGHSVMMKTELMIPFLQRQLFWSEKLIEDFGRDQREWGTWPGWYRGVLSMYAGEIAANERWCDYLQNGRERILDMESDHSGRMDGLTLHIHASQGDKAFSKFKYMAGGYADIDAQQLDKSFIDQYCLWIALTPTDDIMSRAGYPG